MRIFIAIEIPSEIKSAIADWQRELGGRRGWTSPSNVHLTLKFLGEVEAELRAGIEAAAHGAAAEVLPFKLSTAGVGLFPSRREPRILWIGVGGEIEQAVRLQADLDARLSRFGFEREQRPFQPHLTVARLKDPREARRLAARALVSAFPQLEFAVTEMVLMSSQLHPSGAIYTPLNRFKLGGGIAEAQS
jgi:2'-5' RNA ligase